MASTPALVDAAGLRLTMVIFAAAAAAVALVFLGVVHPNPAQPVLPRTPDAALGPLLRNGKLRILFLLALIGLGVFNGLTTWLEPILAPHGIQAEQAGLIGGALILAGIVGAVVIPALSDRLRRRKPFLVLCAVVALVSIHPLCTSTHYAVLLTAAALHGFFFMPAFALLLEMCAQVAGAAAAGAATSLLMMAGNAGGVLVILAIPAVKGGMGDFRRAVYLMVALLAMTTGLAFFAPETFPRPPTGE
jgi:cyanate permease